MISREQGGAEEPMLLAVPTLRLSDLVFPFAVLEGKAYSTGKQVFEAENQAAVSAACGLKIQLCLDELVNRGLSNTTPPLFFSICTQGPIHELWAHFTLFENGVRTFNQVLLQVCHGMLPDSVDDFVIATDNVCRWGGKQFMESVVQRLGTLAKMAGA